MKIVKIVNTSSQCYTVRAFHNNKCQLSLSWWLMKANLYVVFFMWLSELKVLCLQYSSIMSELTDAYPLPVCGRVSWRAYPVGPGSPGFSWFHSTSFRQTRPVSPSSVSCSVWLNFQLKSSKRSDGIVGYRENQILIIIIILNNDFY